MSCKIYSIKIIIVHLSNSENDASTFFFFFNLSFLRRNLRIGDVGLFHMLAVIFNKILYKSIVFLFFVIILAKIFLKSFISWRTNISSKVISTLISSVNSNNLKLSFITTRL